MDRAAPLGPALLPPVPLPPALLAAVLALGAAPALGAAEGPAARLPGTEGLLTTVLGLAVILGLIYVLTWAARRLGGLPAGGGRGLVRILGGVSLGARERVVLVEVEGARLVLGVAPGRVQTLHVLPPAAAEGAPAFARALEEARGPVPGGAP